MIFQAPKFLAQLAFVILSLCFISSAQAQKSDAFAGIWVDRDNPAMIIIIARNNGLYKVSGGDGSFGYSLACLKNKMTAVCTGFGGLLEGQNFLYQNTLEFAPNGGISESWKAFNNLQTINGKTTWIRK